MNQIILCTSEQVPMDRNIGPPCKLYPIGTKEADARALFAARYGVAPETVTVKVTGGGTLARPVPEGRE